MSICHIACDETLKDLIHNCSDFTGADILELKFPITGSSTQIDLLIAGPRITKFSHLASTISDWNMPPVALFVISDSRFEAVREKLSYHPRVGRSIFFANAASETSIQAGLKQCYAFYQRRLELHPANEFSCNYNINNISQRWLFQVMMEHLDEYIYFKDSDSKFLAVSRYLAESCGKQRPDEVLGLSDFDLFDLQHAQDAYDDERKIATGDLRELYKEEKIFKNGKEAWVASRKLPFHTRSNYLAGSFGLSRDITEEKKLHAELEQNHERMQSELLLARNLQETLVQKRIPEFPQSSSQHGLDIATKYIPSFHLSGDFYTILKTDDGNAAILIADVMGHGVRAAMVTAMIQVAVQQLRDLVTVPAFFMNHLNNLICKAMQAAGQTIFATAAFCYLDVHTKKLTYVQAGATHGAYVPAQEGQATSTFNRATISPALGLLSETVYVENTIDIQPGDEIILYTDGIIEAVMDEEEYSEQRLIQFLKEHRNDQLDDMMEMLIDSVKDFTQLKNLDDDVCLIGLRMQSMLEESAWP